MSSYLNPLNWFSRTTAVPPSTTPSTTSTSTTGGVGTGESSISRAEPSKDQRFYTAAWKWVSETRVYKFISPPFAWVWNTLVVPAYSAVMGRIFPSTTTPPNPTSTGGTTGGTTGAPQSAEPKTPTKGTATRGPAVTSSTPPASPSRAATMTPKRGTDEKK